MSNLNICTIHVDDEVNCRVLGLRPEHNKILWEKFGLFVEGYFYMPAYQLRRWDGKIRFFEANGKTFTKILDEIVPYLVSWNYDIELNDKRLPAPVIEVQIDENFFGDIPDRPGWRLRPYQVEVVNALIKEGSGFGICATGAGKTAMCAALSRVLQVHGLQTLIIVPSSDLVTQTVTEFREFLVNHDVTIGEYSGGTKEIDHPIVVATWQSLQNAPHYMKYFKACIVDECFDCNTNILTPDRGYVKISEMQIGDAVYSCDLNGNLILDEVVKVHKSLQISKREKMLEIELENGDFIQVTSNHKFFTNRGWVRADELTSDDEIEDAYKYISQCTMRACNDLENRIKYEN